MEKQQNEQFTARKTMEEHMNVVAAANGYGIVSKSSYRQRDELQVVHYKCDRGGVDRNRHGLVQESKVRKANSSALINCSFKGVGQESKGKATHHGRMSSPRIQRCH